MKFVGISEEAFAFLLVKDPLSGKNQESGEVLESEPSSVQGTRFIGKIKERKSWESLKKPLLFCKSETPPWESSGFPTGLETLKKQLCFL